MPLPRINRVVTILLIFYASVRSCHVRLSTLLLLSTNSRIRFGELHTRSGGLTRERRFLGYSIFFAGVIFLAHMYTHKSILVTTKKVFGFWLCCLLFCIKHQSYSPPQGVRVLRWVWFWGHAHMFSISSATDISSCDLAFFRISATFFSIHSFPTLAAIRFPAVIARHVRNA